MGAVVTAVEELIHSGALARREKGGPLFLVGEPRLSNSLRHRLLTDAGCRSAALETALDTIAILPGVRRSLILDVIERLAGEDAEAELEELEASGVVSPTTAVVPGGLHLDDPILELLLPQTLGAIRRRRLERAALEVLGGVPTEQLTPAESVAVARLSIRMKHDLSGVALTTAARASLSGDDLLLSLDLAEAAVSAGGGPDAEVVLAAAEIRAGRIDGVVDRLRSLSERSEGDLRVLSIVSDLMLLASDRLDLPGGVDERRALVAGSGAAEVALDAFLLFALGDWGGAARRLKPILDDLDGPLAARAHFVFASGSLLTGRFRAAERSLDRAEAILAGAGEDITHIRLARITIGRYTGMLGYCLEQAIAVRDAVSRFGPSHNAATAGWTVGTIELFGGRVVRAEVELGEAIRVLDDHRMDRMALVARCELAEARSLLGDPVGAAFALGPVLVAVGAEGAIAEQFRGRLTQTRAWMLAAGGDRVSAAEAFLGAAEAFAAIGNSVSHLVSLVEAARAGAASAVEQRLRVAGAEVDGPYADLLVEYGRALAGADAHLRAQRGGRAPETAEMAPRFDQVADAAATAGIHYISAEAYARASSAHAAAGDARNAAAAALRRDQQMRLCGIDRLILVPHGEVRPLSLREAEIADLAAAGLSNREISERLVVSIRTVETHLLRVYKKLGIRRRGELADALRSAPRTAAEEH
ncbi:helix-turn-helix transcriptional regulator [Cnuibacter physcomitrellae]|uniref:helix-turn-helix transcriptional regulator n=1 Tax=Cnuibacter physcomitrellae TaxID=1619308 RepID=UPI0021760DD7|nr:helix-turn-helix transcriptional regulator [Cnuibacter physcomitrellae]MCS5495873.1 helix-turn-helix transcriptional regulator [Cnuibacter physcomitrellae]